MPQPVIRQVLRSNSNKYLLDDTSGIQAIYSLRKQKANQLYACRVRDDTASEINVGFIGENLDVSGMLAWSQRNLVLNPTMAIDSDSNGVCDNFNTINDAGDGTQVRTVDGGQKITLSNVTGASFLGGVMQQITCVTGNKFTFSYKYKTANLTGNGVPRVYVFAYDSGGIVISGTPYFSGNLAHSENYTTVTSNEITLPALTTYVRIFFYMSGSNVSGIDGGSVWYKDASLTISNQSIYCTKLYDPANNNDAVQLTASNQPILVNAGVLQLDSGKPTLYFAESKFMNIANSASVNITSSPILLNAVFNNKGANAMVLAKNYDNSSSSQYMLYWDNSIKKMKMYLENIVRHTTEELLNNTLYVYSAVSENNIQKGLVNGATSGSDGNYSGTFTNRQHLRIGCRSNNVDGTSNVGYWTGNISEIIISTNPSTRQKIEKSQSKYYGIAISA